MPSSLQLAAVSGERAYSGSRLRARCKADTQPESPTCGSRGASRCGSRRNASGQVRQDQIRRHLEHLEAGRGYKRPFFSHPMPRAGGLPPLRWSRVVGFRAANRQERSMGRRGYPPEFRRKVLDLVEAGRPIAEVARPWGSATSRSTAGGAKTASNGPGTWPDQQREGRAGRGQAPHC
jgi:hypothetical protein